MKPRARGCPTLERSGRVGDGSYEGESHSQVTDLPSFRMGDTGVKPGPYFFHRRRGKRLKNRSLTVTALWQTGPTGLRTARL